MQAFIYIVIGVLVGWIATLFSDVHDWKPTTADLVVAALGAWLGGTWISSTHASDSAAWPVASILACLVCSAAGVMAWRVVRALWRTPKLQVR